MFRMQCIHLLIWGLLLLLKCHLSEGMPKKAQFVLWQPPDGSSREKYLEQSGLPDKEFKALKEKVPELTGLMADALVADNVLSDSFRRKLDKEDATFKSNRKDDTMKLNDIILSEKQVDRMIKLLRRFLDDNGRKKRKIIDFKQEPEELWDINKKIPYIIDGKFKAKNQDIIVDAIKHWEDNTCVKFERKLPTEDVNTNHIVFFNEQSRCTSKLGRSTEEIPQAIFLSEDVCDPFFGVGVHEIGHALGLIHEQARIGRAKYIKIDFYNLYPPNDTSIIAQFAEWVDGFQQDFGLPYDFGSIMHYGGFDFANSFTTPVIAAKNPLFQASMGQRVGLSFVDIKAVNLAYCSGVCKPPPDCKRGGIPDPNNCNKCLCPDGFGGSTCQTVAGNHHKGCTSPQEIQATSQEQCVTSPNYGSGSYPVGAHCSWHIKASGNNKIMVNFKGAFGVHCTEFVEYCFHWVEIKFKGTLNDGTPGPRFCCYNTPPDKLISDGNLVVVSFKSDINAIEEERKGFKLCFKLVGEGPPPPPIGGDCIRQLNCKTLRKIWQVKATPALNTASLQKVIKDCSGVLMFSGKTITFDLGYLGPSGSNTFKLKKLCVKRSEAKSTLVNLRAPRGSSFTSLPIPKNKNCVNAEDAKDFGTVQDISITIRKKKRKMKISDLEATIDIC